MVLPELKEKGKWIKANLVYLGSVSKKHHVQTQELGFKSHCILFYMLSYSQQSSKLVTSELP